MRPAAPFVLKCHILRAGDLTVVAGDPVPLTVLVGLADSTAEVRHTALANCWYWPIVHCRAPWLWELHGKDTFPRRTAFHVWSALDRAFCGIPRSLGRLGDSGRYERNSLTATWLQATMARSVVVG